jgi:hypothetical protein
LIIVIKLTFSCSAKNTKQALHHPVDVTIESHFKLGQNIANAFSVDGTSFEDVRLEMLNKISQEKVFKVAD